MGVVDPDRAIDETTEFRLTRSRFELHQQPVSRWPPAARHGVECTGRPRMGVRVPFVRGVRIALAGFAFPSDRSPRRRDWWLGR
jgi:hypothetical protein